MTCIGVHARVSCVNLALFLQVYVNFYSITFQAASLGFVKVLPKCLHHGKEYTIYTLSSIIFGFLDSVLCAVCVCVLRVRVRERMMAVSIT